MNDDLKKAIKEDKEKQLSAYCRYPVRFIFMDITRKVQEDIADLLDDYDVNILDLSKKVSHQDAWVTRKDLLDYVENCPKDRDTVVIGFSEMARFYSNVDFEATLLTLVQIENDTSVEKYAERRIYFICFGMRDMMNDVLLHKHHRIDIYNPFLNEDFIFEEPIKDIYFASDKLESLQIDNVIKTSSEWIGLWQNASFYDFSKPFISYSKTLYEWYCKASPDNVFKIGKLDNYKEFIEKLIGIDIPIKYEEKDEDNWFKLYKMFSANSSIQNLRLAVMRSANISDISLNALLEAWLSSSETFVRWLLKGYICAGYGASYISYIMSIMKGDANSEFIELYWLSDYSGSGYSIERKDSFSILSKYSEFNIPEDKLNQRYVDDFNKWIKSNYPVPYCVEGDIAKIDFDIYAEQLSTNKEDFCARVREYFRRFIKDDLTSISVVDRKYAMHLYSSKVIEKEDLFSVFPEVEYYFDNAENVSETAAWIIDYFSEYKNSKVFGKATDKYLDFCRKYNGTNESFYSWLYSIETRNEAIPSEASKMDVYVIDGLGGEWMNLICHFITKYGYSISEARYTRADLPTVTEINKVKISSYKEWFNEFDRDCIHGDIYSSAQNIVKGFDILYRIIDKIVNQQNGDPFIITSDHGATACHRFNKTTKKYNYDKADHGGRCCKLSEKVPDNTDYICYQSDEGYYLVSLNETSLYKTDIYESHGGATIEEVIVPVIVAEKKVAEPHGEINYVITPVKLLVDGIDKSISFTVVPRPKSVAVLEETGVKSDLYEKNGLWTGDLSVGKKQKIIINVDNRKYEYETVSKTASMMGDDGFD